MPEVTQYRNLSGLNLGHDWNKGKFNVEASYSAVHKWVSRNFEKIDKCDFCQSTQEKKYEWANKDGLYKRNRKDWLRLCVSCYRLFDRQTKKHVNYETGRFLCQK